MNMGGNRLSVPEVARRLKLAGPDVYELIFEGQLAGAPEDDGGVYVTEEAIVAYERKVGSAAG
jgi:hypothetical protein